MRIIGIEENWSIGIQYTYMYKHSLCMWNFIEQSSTMYICQRKFISSISSNHRALEERCAYVLTSHKEFREWFICDLSNEQLNTYYFIVTVFILYTYTFNANKSIYTNSLIYYYFSISWSWYNSIEKDETFIMNISHESFVFCFHYIFLFYLNLNNEMLIQSTFFSLFSWGKNFLLFLIPLKW